MSLESARYRWAVSRPLKTVTVVGMRVNPLKSVIKVPVAESPSHILKVMRFVALPCVIYVSTSNGTPLVSMRI